MIKKISVLFVLLGMVITAQAQDWNWRKAVRGEGPTIERQLDVRDFTGIEVKIPGDVFVQKGDNFEVRLVGQANILDLIETSVGGDGNWSIGFSQPTRQIGKLEVYITVPYLDKVSLSGSANVVCKGKFTGAKNFIVGLSGSGDIRLELGAEHTDIRLSGSGNMEISGTAHTQEISVSGSGNIDAYDLETDECDIRISGSGNIKTWVKESLEARISGSGNIYYRGKPRVSTRISGSGDLISRD